MSKTKAAAMGLVLATFTGLFFWLWHRPKERQEEKLVYLVERLGVQLYQHLRKPRKEG